MTKKNVGIAVFSFATIALVAIQSCNLNIAYGIVSISISQGADAASRSGDPKTVFPVIEPESYEISFTGSINPDDITTRSTSEIEKLLRPGEWTIHVDALNAAGEVIAEGDSGTITVVSGATIDVAIRLEAVASGAGSIDIILTWPEPSSTMPEVTGAVVERDGINVASGAVTLNVDSIPPSLRYEETLDAGSYAIVIRLLYGTDSSTIYDEAVQVYANASSSKTVALEEERFTGLPAAPTGLIAVETVAGISLSWADASGIETGYAIERSDGSSSSTHELPANSTAWVDSGVTTGTTYTYSLVAANGTGNSAEATASGLKAAPIPGNSGTITIVETTSSSVSLSWAAATDNRSLQSALSYQVFRDGAAVGEPVAASLSRTVEGLSAETAYTFFVRVTDEAGCTSDYQTVAATTAAASGTVTISIEVIQPSELPMTLSIEEGHIVTDGTLSVSVLQNYSNYSWRLDGTVIGTAQSVSIDCATATPGAHRLSLYITFEGKLYSTSVDFRIHN